MGFKRTLGWSLGLMAALGSVAAQAQTPSQGLPLAACDETQHGFATPLGAAQAPVLPAQALWVDAERLRWPGAAPETRYRLLHSLAGGINAPVGAVPTGFERSVTLLPSTAALPPAFTWVAPGATLALAEPIPRAQRIALTQGQLLLVAEDAQGRVQAATRVQSPGALDALFADAAEPLAFGAMPTPQGTTGRLWAPTARQVSVCLYPSAEAAPTARIPAEWDAASGAWRWQQGSDLSGQFYTYLVEVWVDGPGWVRQRVTDPYSVALGANSRRTAIVDLSDPRTQPPGWTAPTGVREIKRLNEMVVYELHVRDFSRDDPTVRPAWRGKYPAFMERNSQGMRHLRDLARVGVTDIHLLPVFDLATVPEKGCVEPKLPKAPPNSPLQQAAVMAVASQDCFNWGYDPFHFNAPEGSYATDANDPFLRVREFRQMVLALHRAGLRVGLDKVYNHTTASGQSERSVLDRVVPGYYQRLNGQGEVERSTCCDNTATEHRMMAKLMSDSLLLWSREYKLDSYRFDLMGHQPRAAMLAMRERLRRELGREILFIGEGWNFGEVANGARFVQASQLSLKGDGIGTFSDRGRDAARGGSFGNVKELMASQGWLNGLLDDPAKRADALRAADLLRLQVAGTLAEFRFTTHDGATKRGAEIDYAGQPAGYVAQPGEAVHYVENHDNHTLFDANVLKLPATATMLERLHRQNLGNALVAWSQGTVYIHAGQELLRSKSLDRNSYDSGDAFNRLDYGLRDNGFGHGLPPQPDNGRDWDTIAPLLGNPALQPTPAQLRKAVGAFHDVMRIRASSSLFTLPTADEVQKRLRFHAAGAGQDPALIVAELDGANWPGARFGGLLLVFNGASEAREFSVPGSWRLHPVHTAKQAADPRVAAEARKAKAGALRVPGWSAVAFVR
jgi:pullulanase